MILTNNVIAGADSGELHRKKNVNSIFKTFNVYEIMAPSLIASFQQHSVESIPTRCIRVFYTGNRVL